MEFITTIKGGKLLYNIVNIFLIMSFYIMIAGFSTFFKQEYNINAICVVLDKRENEEEKWK